VEETYGKKKKREAQRIIDVVNKDKRHLYPFKRNPKKKEGGDAPAMGFKKKKKEKERQITSDA